MADIAIALPQSAIGIPLQASFYPSSFFTPQPKISILSPEMPNLRQEEEKERFDIWSSIQCQKQGNVTPPAIYIHPLVRRSSSLMTQKSLEICTESLGSETGSDGFSSGDEFEFISSNTVETEEEIEEEEEITEEEIKDVFQEKKELTSVNYHCSIGRRSPARSFPPPLPSISGDGPCLKMRSHRVDGRLVIEAVSVQSQTYLHANRSSGRLILSFINSTRCNQTPSIALVPEIEQSLAEHEEEDEVVEEEVEVVDRGTVVEVKVSGLAAVRVHRSSLVINKFVVGSPVTAADVKVGASTTTAAAAAVAASSMSNYLHHNYDTPSGSQTPPSAVAADGKLLFASKRLRREELLHDMRRCSELRRPLFIFEQPHCIATSS